MWSEINQAIASAIGQPFVTAGAQAVGGGSINQAYVLTDGQSRYFVKLNQPQRELMFRQEALGLQALHQIKAIRVPQVICTGLTERHSFIVLEYLSLCRGSAQAWKRLGQNLAELHRQGRGQRFGWAQDNTIGSTPQINPWTDDWPGFWRDARIGYQLQLARKRGIHLDHADDLLRNIPRLLANHPPQPTLVHGDLWSGNAAFTEDGEPVIFDPAPYYGDWEVDLGMTELFGGFPAEFYQGYESVQRLSVGYQTRKTLYNLYHVLNHGNLFGGSYWHQAQGMINALLTSLE
ncbi:fructosamine kinase family protein [Synechococcus sp. PCC 6312]|uniref:fructosamine kinase family protein n=1 Tax=Synechococcus sp. (strain ATCC 27167 / PCC 6312) TaxID=195253 RepID=UPI00029F02EF|nr:fructosamine kinase family protein [Synechococcus sp. PCC 6312]AFY60396.1 fructosamine-3-kinase [Synechococcus sp. PCC 6312]